VVICRFLTPPSSNNFLRNESCNKVEKIAIPPFPALHLYHWYFLSLSVVLRVTKPSYYHYLSYQVKQYLLRVDQTPASILVAIQLKPEKVVQLKFHEVVQVNSQYSDEIDVHDITVEVL
jgi:hypothetical protein